MIRVLLGVLLLGSVPGPSARPIAISVCSLDQHAGRLDGRRVRVTAMPVPDVHMLTLGDPACFGTRIGVSDDGPGYPALVQMARRKGVRWLEIVGTVKALRDPNGAASGAMLTRIERVGMVERKSD